MDSFFYHTGIIFQAQPGRDDGPISGGGFKVIFSHPGQFYSEPSEPSSPPLIVPSSFLPYFQFFVGFVFFY